MKEKTIYALGVFDGVHLGHQALLLACRELAEARGCRAGVITFSGHPDTLVSGTTPYLLNSINDRTRLLSRYGISRVEILPFDEDLMRLPWQDFFRRLLTEFDAVGLVCGEDFRCGFRGEGTASRLQDACRQAGIPCAVIPQQTLNGTVVSSTYIRNLLETGDMETANRFLGHPHILSAQVVAGRQLGRTIGIPTANMAVPQGLQLPKNGVYACRVLAQGNHYYAVTNVGTRPTVNGTHLTVEPWILDFSGDLYGQEITVEFHHRLREEKTFPSLAALQQEIFRNRSQTLDFFEKL